VLHAPPRVPGDLESFAYTAVVPDPWVQLNFSTAYSSVTATVIVAARSVSGASGYFNPPDQLGINDAFLTYRLPVSEALKFNLNVGAFANTYGNMGEYDLGRYGTPLIARVSGTGATGTGLLRLGDTTVALEAGFLGQLAKAPVGVEPAGWNGFADANVGTSWVPHAHLVVGYQNLVQLGFHLLYAFTRDDRTAPAQPDGDITVLGLDARLTLGRFGHLYAGYAQTEAKSARAVSDVLRVLNAPGGKGLMDEYFGATSNGTGKLETLGAQYDFSLGNYLRYPGHFDGDGPDLIASLFTIFTRVDDEQGHVTDKAKYGAEVGYSLLSWLAVAGRYDRVLSDVGDDTQTLAVLTGRVILHSGWSSHDQVALQYSRWFCGSSTLVKDGYPPAYDPTIVPDAHVVSLMATLWW
jgi:hypothetical protein